MISINLVYATADKQQIVPLSIAPGTQARTVVMNAVKESQVILYGDNENAHTVPIGVYGQQVADDYILEEGDRLEIYRPLMQDPKERRRKEANRKSGNKTS